MATNQLTRVIHNLREATLPHDDACRTDGQLLECYIRSREETAFARLVHRHGPMVWGVCRRVLRSHQDAEDAFQATFLILVRKAASIVSKELVANWLYGVAHQTALKARATTAKRGTREKQVTVMPEPVLEQQELWDDLQPLLDQELSCLPDKYRAVIALCDLEGKTRKEAARQLGLPEGTVASRLATARTMLAKRLERHGLRVSGVALAAVLARNAVSASVPNSVASSTIQAATLFAAGPAAATGAISAKAVALAEGVLKTMLLTKLKIATAVLVVMAVVGAGATTLKQQVLADKPPDLASRERKQPEPPADKPPDSANRERRRPEPPADALPTSIGGVVKAVDAGKSTLTVAHRDGETTFTVAKDANINIDGKLDQLSGLPAGANVTLSQFTDPTTARTLQASGRWYFGAPVKAVDVEKDTLTISEREGDKTFRVALCAFITVDGKPCKLAAVPPGAFVNLGLAVDQQTICSIGADGPYLGGCGGSMVKAVDSEKSTITFDDKAAAAVAGKTFVITKDANIVIDGKPGTLAEVPTGAYVNLGLTVDQQAARQVHVQGPPVQCDCGGSMVKAVDADKNTITFDDTARAEVAGKTFIVAKDANIVIDGRPGKLAELPTGAYVNLTLSVDQQTARQVRAQGANVNGIVKAVDAEKNTLTVNDRTYAVAKDVVIVVEGQRGTLAGLPTGIFVSVTLHVDQQTVGLINQTKAP